MKRAISLIVCLLCLAAGAHAQDFKENSEADTGKKSVDFILTSSTDGSEITSASIAGNNDSDCADLTDDCCVFINGGTGTYCQGTITNKLGGYWIYTPHATELATNGRVVIRFAFTGTNKTYAQYLVGDAESTWLGKIMAAMFTTNSGQTSSTAVAGSVVKEARGTGGGGTSGIVNR